MRSFVICIFVIVLVEAGLCGRLRRQIVPAIGKSPPSADTAKAAADPTKNVGGVDNAKVDSLQDAKPMMMADAKKQTDFGVPVPVENIDGVLGDALPADV